MLPLLTLTNYTLLHCKLKGFALVLIPNVHKKSHSFGKGIGIIDFSMILVLKRTKQLKGSTLKRKSCESLLVKGTRGE